MKHRRSNYKGAFKRFARGSYKPRGKVRFLRRKSSGTLFKR